MVSLWHSSTIYQKAGIKCMFDSRLFEPWVKVPHAFIVLSERARLLVFQTPGVGQGFYRGASEPATSDAAGRVDFARLRAAAQTYAGVEILGPPPFDPATLG